MSATADFGWARAVLRLLVELTVLFLGSALVGFVIGTLQHYVSFGIWGYGFSKDALELALLEGGIVGSLFAIPTGLGIFYLVFKRRVNPRRILVTAVGSLLGGCLLGILFFWASAFLTPFVTLSIALGLTPHSERTANQ